MLHAVRFIRSLLSDHLAQKRLAGGALVLAVTQFAASLAGFFRDQAFSITFPLESDPIGIASVYIASFRLSDLLFQMFVMSSLSIVLVPFLAYHLAGEREEEMNRITTSILTVFGVIFGLAACLLAAFFPLIAPLLVQYEGEALALYVTFGRLALFTNFLFVFGNTLGQYLIARQRYWTYGITPVIWSLGTIGGIYLLTPVVGLVGPMLGTIIGTVLYLLLRLAGAMRAGLRFRLPAEGVIHPELLQMGWLILPRMAALGMLQLQLLLFDTIGSGLGSEAVAVNAFARNFQSVVVGVAGIALAQSAFSLLSQSAAKGEYHRFRAYLRKGLLFNVVLTVPAAIGLAALSFIPAWMLHLEGAARAAFLLSLSLYCVSIPFESINHLLLRAFSSLKDTLMPAFGTMAALFTGTACAFFLAGRYGLAALPVGFAVGQITQLVFLSSFLPMVIRRKAEGANWFFRWRRR